MFALVSSSRVKHQSISEVNQQGVSAMNYISRAIQGADSITSPGPGATAVSLVLTVPDAGSSPTTFNVSGGVVNVTEGLGSPLALTGGKVTVDSLSFTNLSGPGSPGIVQINLTLSRVNSSGRNEYSYQKTFIVSEAIRR